MGGSCCYSGWSCSAACGANFLEAGRTMSRLADGGRMKRDRFLLTATPAVSADVEEKIEKVEADVETLRASLRADRRVSRDSQDSARPEPRL